MNIKEELTCQYCNKIYKDPITLTCGDSICRHHAEETLLTNSSNKFFCPICNEENKNHDFKVNKILENLIKKELHEFKLNPKYEETLNSLKSKITTLENILNDHQNFIYEEISELKRQVDLDRENIKSDIDKLADDLIQQLESYKARFNTEFKTNVDLDFYNGLVESSKKQFIEYERHLSLFSVENQQREEKYKQSEQLVEVLHPKINELKEKIFSNLSLKYRKTENNIENMFGKLIIQENKKPNKNEFLGVAKMTLDEHSEVVALAVLPNGDLISGSSNKILKIWNVSDWTVKQTLNSHGVGLKEFIVLDNNRVINASGDKTIEIWNFNDGTLEKTFKGHSNGITAFVLLKNGELASGSADKTIKIWNIKDGTLKRTLTDHLNGVSALVLLNNGDMASGSWDTTIKIWDVETGTVKKTLTGHTLGVRSLVIFENGDLVSGSWDRTIKIWNVEDGSVKRTFTGHTSFVLALRVLHNGDLVSGSADRTIKIWDVENGALKKDILVNSRVNALEVLQNGDLASASDESIQIWD